MDTSNTQDEDAIFVLTGRGVETMLAEGGSQAWSIDSKRSRDCRYVVCIQNHKQDYFETGQLSAPHHTAFMVGKLAGICPADQISDAAGTRKKLLMSEYALIDVPDAWPGNRNPVFYGSLKAFGIDLQALQFNAMPPVQTQTPKVQTTQALTIAQAKAGLALQFGVTTSEIEITIRA